MEQMCQISRKSERVGYMAVPRWHDMELAGNQKGQNLNLWEETLVLLYCLKVSHLACVKIAKKEI